MDAHGPLNQFFPIAGIDHERALQSPERFAELLETSPTADSFARSFEAEFDVYKSAGWDGAGGGVPSPRTARRSSPAA